ncbi:hypothetical protein [Levilactobacillus bambusae]|uniref:Uncharacterized protein n=1 Tax=Levilactobacillus bambusae TaxID=2024736 RepID=A0A2V1N0B8_9LACO|nr:hypothetical protein [Levilactobacillus bambusae]PWG00689.1 hypothetical protein DCM90_00495 [Levilactobacillus bambusae]
MAIRGKAKRQDNLDSKFGTFAELDPRDSARDKFLKHGNHAEKKAKPIITPKKHHHKISDDEK